MCVLLVGVLYMDTVELLVDLTRVCTLNSGACLVFGECEKMLLAVRVQTDVGWHIYAELSAVTSLVVWHLQAEISSLQQLLLSKNAEIESLHTQLLARPSLTTESSERGEQSTHSFKHSHQPATYSPSLGELPAQIDDTDNDSN